MILNALFAETFDMEGRQSIIALVLVSEKDWCLIPAVEALAAVLL